MNRDLAKKIAREQVRYNLRKAFNKFGLEGTEQKIKEIYPDGSKLQQIFLEEYYLIMWGVK